MKNYKLFTAAFVGSALFLFSCGGGGVPENFTKQINDTELAWKNASASLSTSIDSITATKASWTTMSAEMKVPDSLSAAVEPQTAKELDSLKGICTNQGASYDKLLTESSAYLTQVKSDESAFLAWKDKVIKGEIDVETAKKDLKMYSEKVGEISSRSGDIMSKITEIKKQCSDDCGKFSTIVQGLAQPKEEKPR